MINPIRENLFLIMLALSVFSCEGKEILVNYPDPPGDELFAFGALGHGLPSCFKIYAIQPVDVAFPIEQEVEDATVIIYRNDLLWLEITNSGLSPNCDREDPKTGLYYYQSIPSGSCYCSPAATFLDESAEYYVEVSAAGYNTVTSAPLSFVDRLQRAELDVNLSVSPGGSHYYDAPLITAETSLPGFHVRHATYALLDIDGDGVVDTVENATRDDSYNVNSTSIQLQPTMNQAAWYDTGVDTCTLVLWPIPPLTDTTYLENFECYTSPSAYKTYLLSLPSEYNQFWQLRAESSSPELGGFLLDNPRGITNMSNGFGFVTTAELDSAIAEL